MKNQSLILTVILTITAVTAISAQAGAVFPLADADISEFGLDRGADRDAKNVFVAIGTLDADHDLFEVTGDPDDYISVVLPYDPILDADFGQMGEWSSRASTEVAKR